MPSVERVSLIRWAGVALLILAFALPGIEWQNGEVNFTFKDAGISMFLGAPFYIHKLIFSPESMAHFMLGLWSAAAWSSNFSALFKLDRYLAWIPLVAPWAWLCVYLIFENDIGLGLLGYWPMYPWLVGLTLLNVSVYLKDRSDGPTPYQPL